jgi:hypothetical protein
VGGEAVAVACGLELVECPGDHSAALEPSAPSQHHRIGVALLAGKLGGIDVLEPDEGGMPANLFHHVMRGQLAVGTQVPSEHVMLGVSRQHQRNLHVLARQGATSPGTGSAGSRAAWQTGLTLIWCLYGNQEGDDHARREAR